MSKKKHESVVNFKPFIPKESIKYAVATLKTPWIGGDGPRVKEFEQAVSKIVKNKNVVAVSSGTSALCLALRLAEVKGAEVITTPMTCIATNTAIALEGATPVWTDINPETGNIEPKLLASRITKKTKAIMVVHWGGAPVDLRSISKIARKYKLKVIEDASQALGSEYGGKPIGSHSDFVVFSFQAIKIINTVDGGLLTTKKRGDADRARALRWYGVDREKRIWDKNYNFWEYPVNEIGYKMQMTDVEASIGLGQLPYLKQHLLHRRKLALIYEKMLSRSKTIKAQKIEPGAKPNYWLFTVVCDSRDIKLRLYKELQKIGVRSEEAHRRNDLYPVFAKYKKDKLPGVTFFNDNHLIIPVGHWVSMKKGLEIAKVLASF